MTATVSSQDAGYVTAHSPPETTVGSASGRERYGWARPGATAQCDRSDRIASTTTVARSIAFTAPPRCQCGCRTSACPGRPGTETWQYSEPRQAIQTSNPVGSVTM